MHLYMGQGFQYSFALLSDFAALFPGITEKRATKSDKRAQGCIFPLIFSKFRAFRMLHSIKGFEEVNIEEGILIFKKGCPSTSG